jgi:hypothetical protein
MWHFETHARQCKECYSPLKVKQKGERLCNDGSALAQDVVEHVYQEAGKIYSKKRDNNKPVRVELPANYTHTRELLQAVELAASLKIQTTPIISHDPTFPVTRRRSPSPDRRRRYRDENQTETVHIEPADTERRRRATNKQRRYPNVVVNDDIDLAREPEKKPDPRRGSLYATAIQWLKKDKSYTAKVREPESDRYQDGAGSSKGKGRQ